MRIQTIPPQRADVAELLHVERRSLGDSDFSVDEALHVLRLPTHCCLGAYVGASLAGFLFCFETCATNGLRLELDMLGVLPEHRNRGLATALISAALAQARATGITQARAVVRTDNAASLAAFRKGGLTIAGEAALLIWDHPTAPAGSQPMSGVKCALERTRLQAPGGAPSATRVALRRGNDVVASALALEVSTLAYRGCWIEELDGVCATDGAALATLLGQDAVQSGLLEAGILMPLEQAATYNALLARGWQETGRFHVLCWSA